MACESVVLRIIVQADEEYCKVITARSKWNPMPVWKSKRGCYSHRKHRVLGSSLSSWPLLLKWDFLSWEKLNNRLWRSTIESYYTLCPPWEYNDCRERRCHSQKRKISVVMASVERFKQRYQDRRRFLSLWLGIIPYYNKKQRERRTAWIARLFLKTVEYSDRKLWRFRLLMHIWIRHFVNKWSQTYIKPLKSCMACLDSVTFKSFEFSQHVDEIGLP